MSQKLKTLWIVLAGIVCLPQISPAQEVRIAVIDIEVLTYTSDDGKAANDKLEKRFQAISAEMDKARKDIEEKETRLRTQDRLMSAGAKSQLTKEIDDGKKQFDRKNEDYQKEMADLQSELLAPVSEKIQQELKIYVEEKGPTLLIDLSAERGNIVWANPGNDITKDMLTRLNANKTPAAAPEPASAKPPATPPAAPPAAPGK